MGLQRRPFQVFALRKTPKKEESYGNRKHHFATRKFREGYVGGNKGSIYGKGVFTPGNFDQKRTGFWRGNGFPGEVVVEPCKEQP